MLLELVLVAAVLALVGLALYQSNHNRASKADQTQPVKLTTAQSAETTIKAIEKDVDAEIATAAAAETTTDEMVSASEDVINLGASADANNF